MSLIMCTYGGGELSSTFPSKQKKYAVTLSANHKNVCNVGGIMEQMTLKKVN